MRDGGRIERGDVLLDAGELSRVLEFSAAPGIWLSCCRGMRERVCVENTGDLVSFSKNVCWR